MKPLKHMKSCERNTRVVVGCVCVLFFILIVFIVGYVLINEPEPWHPSSLTKMYPIWVFSVTGKLDARILRSWSEMNITTKWDVIILTPENFKCYIGERRCSDTSINTHVQDENDMALSVCRQILMEYGGVFVFSPETLCDRPLHDWVFDALSPDGFWLDVSRMDIIISIRQARILKEWTSAIHTAQTTQPGTTIPMERIILMDVIRTHSRLIGNPRPLSYDPTQLVLVLSACDFDQQFNKFLHYVRHVEPPNRPQIIIYDKCDFCRSMPAEDDLIVLVRPLPNVGREMGTFLYFVIQHYDNLPEEFILSAANFSKHRRLDRVIDLIEHPDKRRDPSSHCGVLYSELRNFTLPIYEGTPLVLAPTRPFGAWFETHVGPWIEGSLGPCWNGIMGSTRARIHRHPIDFYENLYKQCTIHSNFEAGHFLERAMGAIF